MGPIIQALVPSAPTGEGGGGARRRPACLALAAALCFAAAAAFAGCGSDEPALTLAFQGVPPGTTDIRVTLHAANVTFAGPDASSGDVDVTYAGGDVQIAIDGAFAGQHANRVRLPLTSSADIPRLEGTARATGGVAEKTAQAWTPVAAHQSASLAFDFSADGGADAGPPDGGAPAPERRRGPRRRRQARPAVAGRVHRCLAPRRLRRRARGRTHRHGARRRARGRTH